LGGSNCHSACTSDWPWKAGIVNFGVTSKFKQVGKYANTESMNNENLCLENVPTEVLEYTMCDVVWISQNWFWKKLGTAD
jgi:hypothetical protein